MTERKILVRTELVKLVKEVRDFKMKNKVHHILVDAFTLFASNLEGNSEIPMTITLSKNLSLVEFIQMREDLLSQWGYKETDLMTFHPQDEHSAEYGITLCIPEEAFKYE